MLWLFIDPDMEYGHDSCLIFIDFFICSWLLHEIAVCFNLILISVYDNSLCKVSRVPDECWPQEQVQHLWRGHALIEVSVGPEYNSCMDNLAAYHGSSVARVHSTDESGEIFKLGDTGAWFWGLYFKMALSLNRHFFRIIFPQMAKVR